METTTTKLLGSVDQYTIELVGDRVMFKWYDSQENKTVCTSYSVAAIEANAKTHPLHEKVWALIQSAQPAQPRAEMIETIATELAKFASDKPWDERLPFDQKYIREQATAVVGVVGRESVAAQPAPAMNRDGLIERLEVLLINRTTMENPGIIAEIVVVDALPELKPKPAPVEVVRTEGTRIADAMFTPYEAGGFVLHVAGNGYHLPTLCTEALVDLVRQFVRETVDARDAVHQKAITELAHTHLMALADLQNRCADMMENHYRCPGLAKAIRNVPLTTAVAQ